MDEQEIGAMIVRLTGDGSEYQKMLSDAQQQTQAAAAQVEAAASRIEGFTSSLSGFASAAVSGLASLGAGSFLKSAFGSFLKAEEGALRLNAAIEGGGHAAASVLPQYQEFASQMAETTTQTRGSIMGLLRQAEVAGFSGDAAERLTRNAIGLSQATEMGTEHAMMLAAAMERGDTHMLRRVPALRGITDESELMARAQQLMATGMRMAEDESNSLGGQLTHLQHEYEGLTKQFGSTVAELVGPLIEGLREVVSWFAGLSKETKTTIVVVLALVAAFAMLPFVIGIAGAVFNTMFGGVGLLLGVIAMAGVGIAAWANEMGGLSKAWEKVKEVSGTVWDFIKKNVTLIVAMVGGPIGMVIALVVTMMGGWKAAWEKVKYAASATWTWIKQTTLAFIDWVTPAFQAVVAFYQRSWRVISYVAGVAWDWVKGKLAAFWAWASPYVTAGIDALVAGWNWLKDTAVATWDWIKEKVSAFVVWATPIIGAWVGYVSALWDILKRAATATWEWVSDRAMEAWELIKAGATWLWDKVTTIFSNVLEFISDIWTSIAGDASVNWQDVQDFIVEALIVAEFTLDNFGTVASQAWLAAQIGFMTLTGTISHFFTGTLPALLTWFGSNWQSVWQTAMSYQVAVVRNMGANFVAVFRNLPGLIAGTVQWSEIWTPLATSAVNTIQGLPRIPERVMSQTEQALRRQFESQGAVLSASFDEFRARRLKEINSFGIGFDMPEAQDAIEHALHAAARVGQQTGEQYRKEAHKEMQKFDAVIFGSAEGLARLADWTARTVEQHVNAGRTRNYVTPDSVAAPTASQTTPAANPDSREQTGLMTQMRDLLQRLNDRPQVELEAR